MPKRAKRAQAGYHYFLYLMASSSCGGAYPPKFNGMLWNTGGDVRAWGAQHWFTNLSCYYEALPAPGRFELMEPMYAMYWVPEAQTVEWDDPTYSSGEIASKYLNNIVEQDPRAIKRSTSEFPVCAHQSGWH